MKTAIHFGADALGRLKDIPYKRVLVVTDPFVVKSGMIDMITKPLQAGGKEFDIFCDVVPDAPVGKIAEGVKKFLQYQPEAIVAVGGGSAIDSSKAIREFALKINNYGKVGLVAIPTTSGTGSEVTSFAVVNDTEAHVKYPLISDSLTADEAILDAELVRSVPPAITADTGMDVLTHAIESYVSINHNEFTSALAEKSIEICGVYLYRAYVDGNDMHARQKMHVRPVWQDFPSMQQVLELLTVWLISWVLFSIFLTEELMRCYCRILLNIMQISTNAAEVRKNIFRQ